MQAMLRILLTLFVLSWANVLSANDARHCLELTEDGPDRTFAKNVCDETVSLFFCTKSQCDKNSSMFGLSLGKVSLEPNDVQELYSSYENVLSNFGACTGTNLATSYLSYKKHYPSYYCDDEYVNNESSNTDAYSTKGAVDSKTKGVSYVANAVSCLEIKEVVEQERNDSWDGSDVKNYSIKNNCGDKVTVLYCQYTWDCSAQQVRRSLVLKRDEASNIKLYEEKSIAACLGDYGTIQYTNKMKHQYKCQDPAEYVQNHFISPDPDYPINQRRAKCNDIEMECTDDDFGRWTKVKPWGMNIDCKNKPPEFITVKEYIAPSAQIFIFESEKYGRTILNKYGRNAVITNEDVFNLLLKVCYEMSDDNINSDDSFIKNQIDALKKNNIELIIKTKTAVFGVRG